MKIYVKTLTSKIITVEDLNQNTTISDIKQKIYDHEDLRPLMQDIIFDGGILDDVTTLSDVNIKNESMVYLRIVTTRIMQQYQNRIKELFSLWNCCKGNYLFLLPKDILYKILLLLDPPFPHWTDDNKLKCIQMVLWYNKND